MPSRETGLPSFQSLGIDHLLNAWLQDRIKILTHFHEYIFSFSAIFTVEIDYSMGGCPRASKEIENQPLILIAQSSVNTVSNCKKWILEK